MKKLKEYQTNTSEVSFALGCHYSDGDTDIRRAMSIADKKMYHDKQMYYERFPERRRK